MAEWLVAFALKKSRNIRKVTPQKKSAIRTSELFAALFIITGDN